MNPDNNIEKKLEDLANNIGSDDKLVEKVMKQIDASDSPEKHEPMQKIRRIVMNRYSKLAAILAIFMGLAIWSQMGGEVIPSAYALHDSLEAYNSIKWLYVKESHPVGNQTRTSETWLQCDDYGNIIRLRFQTPYCGEPIGSLAIAGSFDSFDAWIQRYNTHLTGYGNPSEIFGFDITELDPKTLLEKLIQQEKAEQIILDFNESTPKNEPRIVTITYPQGSLSQNWKKVLYVDRATNLISKIEKFQKRNDQFILKKTHEFSGYNDQIDLSMFTFDDELPDNVKTIDMSAVEVGLEQGDMTDEEVAAEIVRQFFEAAMTNDFERAGQLYLAAPDYMVKNAFMGANILEISSIGPAYPDTDPDSKAMFCPAKAILEIGGEHYELTANWMKVNVAEETSKTWVICGSSITVKPIAGVN